MHFFCVQTYTGRKSLLSTDNGWAAGLSDINMCFVFDISISYFSLVDKATSLNKPGDLTE